MKVVLTKAATYRTTQLYRQGKPAYVSEEEGQRLLKTGVFDTMVEPAAVEQEEPTPTANPLDDYKVDELRELATSFGLPTGGQKKQELIDAITLFQMAQQLDSEPTDDGQQSGEQSGEQSGAGTENTDSSNVTPAVAP